MTREDRLDLIAMSTGRREDYAKLDEIGYDVVHALLFGNGDGNRYTEESLAKKYGVSRFNLKLWMRKQRTYTFLDEIGAEGVLELIAGGTSLAMLADEHQLSNGILEHWAKEKIPPDVMKEARDHAAEAWFSQADSDFKNSTSDLELAQTRERVKLKQWIAGNVTKRFSEDKTIRVTPGEGVVFAISYGRPDEPPP